MGRRACASPLVETQLTLRIDGRAYAWHELLLPSPDGATEWWHPGLATLVDGQLLLFRQGGRELLAVDRVGAHTIRRDLPLRIGHGITVDPDGTSIWLADPGLHAQLVEGRIVRDTSSGRVIRADIADAVEFGLETPPLPIYRHEPYRPTSVALVADQVWVADGYGQSLVHRFDSGGDYLRTIDGSDGGRRFDCPHALFVDPRAPEPLVWITDRGNAVLQAFDADGRFVRALGAGTLTSPSGIAALGPLLVIAELSGSLSVFDADDRFIGIVGKSGRTRQDPGWPNAEVDGRTARPPLHDEAFNSPHAIASRPDGSLIVAEWLLGGRLVELLPLAS
jgi:hypothetical protein